MVEWRIERRPLTGQVRDLIWNMLKDENFQPGDRLPSEMELVNRFRISRGALREALKILEEERVIFCQHGVGRFVAPDLSGVLQEDITHLKSVSELAGSLGITFTCQVLSVQQRPVDEPVSRLLDLDPGADIVVLERVWCEQNEPVIYSLDHFPLDLIGGVLTPERFQGSLLAMIERSGQSRLEYARTTIQAVLLDPAVTRRLGADGDKPWILLEQVNYDKKDAPILFSRDYYYADKFQFYVLRRRR